MMCQDSGGGAVLFPARLFIVLGGEFTPVRCIITERARVPVVEAAKWAVVYKVHGVGRQRRIFSFAGDGNSVVKLARAVFAI